MAPPIPLFPASTLPTAINSLPSSPSPSDLSTKPRKPAIALADCALKELVQYRCDIAKGQTRGLAQGKRKMPDIVCEPVVRFYRVCRDGLMVETTVWEKLQKE
ncbi:hypothetical protein P154DRAFT_576665 [Amniculicola lignicola CBS 123094]|uniref:Uncharacterized protein n=1 Tax=Amniculicola lignicola CBS 123094 TaxID=1392246 RepID=A0A6A5WFA0_9PLEO|nr:hypothetical protein P154DRAFT_576665 [Amniculicola lignicola CBS 123094]